MGVFAVGLVIIVDARALWQVWVFAACFGIGFGGGIVCLMSVLSNYFGTHAFASLAGLAIAINTTLSAIAPKVAGRLFDQGSRLRCYVLFSGSMVLHRRRGVVFHAPAGSRGGERRCGGLSLR
jgi:MFS family permease